MIKFIKKCPLTLMIIVTFLALNIYGLVAIYNDTVDAGEVTVTHPLIASVFEHVTDMSGTQAGYEYDETPIDAISSFAIGVASSDGDDLSTALSGAGQNGSPDISDDLGENSKKNKDAQKETSSSDSEETSENSEAEGNGEDTNVYYEQEQTEPVTYDVYEPVAALASVTFDDAATAANYGKVIYTDRYTGQVVSPSGNEDSVKASSTVYNYSGVGTDFFANTLFIGDSRIGGLASYGGLDSASYCYKNGLTAWSLFEGDFLDAGMAPTTLDEALLAKTYDYIYVMLGINEASWGTAVSFANQFRTDILYIRDKQPTAKIVIMGIMQVTRAYSDSEDRSVDEIMTRNVYLSYLANGVDVFYLDVNDAICDETGAMYESYSYDGVHLRAQYYPLWTDYICKHVFIK